MSYVVSTAVFEGPLDLLLQLITRHQVDIAEVSLTRLVEEYVGYLDEMRSLDLEVTSEFILIAATLIELKASHLLPRGDDPDVDEELALMEERDRLLSRLLMCVTFKDVAAVFLRRFEEGQLFVPRVSGLDQTISPRPTEIRLPVDTGGLLQIARRVLARAEAAPDLDHLDLELPSVEEAMAEIRSRMAAVIESTFEDLIAHCRRRIDVAAYFLALLELARWGLLSVQQESWDGSITVRSQPQAVIDLTGSS
ncbi:MAG TPA: ScpA family protein [Acidimicrobiia bacterium]|nr:ScpA family protein [Acidimicrobiia bacterium]